MRRHLITAKEFKYPAVLAATLLLLLCFLVPEAKALPQFSRQYELKCSQCHVAPPLLNATGRRHMEKGYRFFMAERDKKSLKELFRPDRTIPLGIWLSARPYEKVNSGESIDPRPEARLYAAGGIYRDFSAFVRVDIEGEEKPRINSEIATLSYNPSELFNLHVARASIVHHDNFDTLQNTRQLTLRQNAVLSRSFGGADNNGSLSSPRQGIHLSGRAMDSLFYMLGGSGNADDTDLTDFSTVSGRVAYEIEPVGGYRSFNLAFGTFGMWGHDKDNSDRRFSRIAADTQMDIPLIRVRMPGLLRLTGTYLRAEDDLLPNGSAENSAWYAQAMYITMWKGRPYWVPIVRWDHYTENGDGDDFSELTLNLTYYFVENFRAQLEYWKQLEVPAGQGKDHSTMVQVVFLY